MATDLWPYTYADPDPDAGSVLVVLLNALWALILTGFAVLYLVLTYRSPNQAVLDNVPETTDRLNIEKAFLTGALSFFVGWQWVILVRDIDVFFYRSIQPQVDMTVTVGTSLLLSTIIFFMAKHRIMKGVWWGDAVLPPKKPGFVSRAARSAARLLGSPLGSPAKSGSGTDGV